MGRGVPKGIDLVYRRARRYFRGWERSLLDVYYERRYNYTGKARFYKVAIAKGLGESRGLVGGRLMKLPRWIASRQILYQTKGANATTLLSRSIFIISLA